MTMSNKCIVKGCNNHHHEGKFQTFELCMPCYNTLVTGKVEKSNTTFIGDLNRENEYAVKECCGGLDVKSCPNCVPALRKEIDRITEIASKRGKVLTNTVEYIRSCP